VVTNVQLNVSLRSLSFCLDLIGPGLLPSCALQFSQVWQLTPWRPRQSECIQSLSKHPQWHCIILYYIDVYCIILCYSYSQNVNASLHCFTFTNDLFPPQCYSKKKRTSKIFQAMWRSMCWCRSMRPLNAPRTSCKLSPWSPAIATPNANHR